MSFLCLTHMALKGLSMWLYLSFADSLRYLLTSKLFGEIHLLVKQLLKSHFKTRLHWLCRQGWIYCNCQTNGLIDFFLLDFRARDYFELLNSRSPLAPYCFFYLTVQEDLGRLRNRWLGGKSVTCFVCSNYLLEAAERDSQLGS